jgi:hypothetical protein
MGIATYMKQVVGNFFGSVRGYTLWDDYGTPRAFGRATVWKDMVFPLVQKTTGPGNPNFTEFNGNLVKPQFAVNDALQLESSEVFHEWMEGSTGDIHAHITSMTNVNAARGIKLEVEYSYVARVDGTKQWIAPVTVSAELTVPANTPALTEFVLPIANLTVEDGMVGGQICMRVKRIASVGTAPATDPFLTQVGVHLECNTGGSDARFTKLVEE